MEKYGVEIEPRLQGLLQEEANLMQSMQKFMHANEKTASEKTEEARISAQLASVREAIESVRASR